MATLGIDPGAGGGHGVVGDTAESSFAWKMPPSAPEAWARLRGEIAGEGVTDAYLEVVHAMPGQGVTSMFNFGKNYGWCEMALAALGIRTHLVRPKVWQKEFGLLSKKGESKKDKKNRHKAEAMRLFPHIKVTHALADALLIAEYGRRQR